jgi:ferredoxin
MSAAEAGSQFAIDTSICSGHGRCYAIAPEFFDADDIGYGQVRIDARAVSEAEAMEVIISCPEDAISLVNAPTSEDRG